MRNKYICISIILFLMVLASSCFDFIYSEELQSRNLGGDRIIAVINNEIITQSEVEELLAVFYMQARSKYSGEALERKLENLRRVALDRLIEDKLILEEAGRQEIKISDEEIEERLAAIKSRFRDEAEFQRELAAQGITVSDIRKRLREQLMISRAVELNVKKNIYVSPTEITAYYQANKEKFEEPESVQVDSIFCKSKNKIEEAQLALNKGTDFQEVKRRFSQGSSVGIVKKGELLKEIEEVIFNLKMMEVSDIVETKNGFYIFKLIKKIPGRLLSLSEVEAKIKDYLIGKKTEERFRAWIKKLKQDAYIVIK